MTLLLILLGVLVINRAMVRPTTAPIQAANAEGRLPWQLDSHVSVAGSDGTGQTSPLAALLGSFSAAFGPSPYVPLSGPGGATVSPGLSPAPSGQATSPLVPTAPGAVVDMATGAIAVASDPVYWFLAQPLDTVLMNEDVSEAMVDAKEFDTAAFLDASLGSSWGV